MVYISPDAWSWRQFSLVEDPKARVKCADLVSVKVSRSSARFIRNVRSRAVSVEDYPPVHPVGTSKMDLSKCVFVLLACSAFVYASTTTKDDDGIVDRGFRAMYRVYEECQHRNMAVSPCLKKKAISFFERLGRMRTLPLSENFELIRTTDEAPKSSTADLEASLGRNAGSKDEILTEILLDRVASLLNSFNVQIRLPKTSPGELKRGMEEGRGKMKKMMGMMMMGMAMKMAALIPLALGVLFLLAGKALIISKIALVLSLIIGLKKLLSQKQSHDHGGWQQSGGGWDRSLKGVLGSTETTTTEAAQNYAHSLAYSARHLH